MFPPRCVQGRDAQALSRHAPLGPRSLLAPLAVLVALCGSGCAGGAQEPTRACLTIESSENLNLYDGQPHAVTLYFYPLSGQQGFRQASVQDLLEGHMPSDALGQKPIPMTIGPGEAEIFDQPLSPSASYVGVVADYYRAPGDPEGKYKTVVPAECGWFGTTTITLLPSELAESN